MTGTASESSLRVVHLSFRADPLQRDGETLLREWSTLPDVARAVSDAGVTVTVVQASHRRETVYRNGLAFHFVEDPGGMAVHLPLGMRWPRRPARILDAVADTAPSVLHVHGFHYPVAIRQLARRLPGVPILLQDHATATLAWSRRLLWRWASQRIDGVAFTTRSQAAGLIESGSLRSDIRVFEILEGSTDFRPGDREEARRRTGITGHPAFLWTGNLDVNKDPLTVLAGFSLAARQLPDARLWCCFRHAPLLEDVQRRIASDPVLKDRVTLLGFQPHAELEHHYRAADFFVQMSQREGSGYSVVEALACGATPLVSDIAPLRRIVGDAGSLTPVRDAEALALAMTAWASRDQPGLRRAARTRFADALSFERIGRDLRRAYETLACTR